MIAQKAQDTPQERVRVLQRKLYRAAKDAPQRTFGVLYDKIHRKKVDSYVYAKLVNFLRRKHKRRGKGYREFPPSFFKKAGLYQLHGTIVRHQMS